MNDQNFTQTPKFQKAIQSIDEYNRQDPNTIVWNQQDTPKELAYAIQMSGYLNCFNPTASEALKLAARAQHIGRWEIPRDKYPMNAPGYHQWRNALMKLHAKITRDILEAHHYEPEMIEQVTSLIQKKGLKTNPETQCLEDVICLVFLEYYFADFAEKHPKSKVIDILQKTWKKMSEKGHEAALRINFDSSSAELIKQALS